MQLQISASLKIREFTFILFQLPKSNFGTVYQSSIYLFWHTDQTSSLSASDRSPMLRLPHRIVAFLFYTHDSFKQSKVKQKFN